MCSNFTTDSKESPLVEIVRKMCIVGEGRRVTMRLIFRPELGEEHRFVLLQTSTGKVFFIYEPLIRPVLIVILLFAVFFGVDRTSVMWAIFGVITLASITYVDVRMELTPWERK
jgi:hypothetical protein